MLGITVFTPSHLLCIHSPHCKHNTVITFPLKLHTHICKNTFRLVIIFNANTDNHHGFPKINFQTLAPKRTLYFLNLFLSHLMVSLIRTKSSTYSSSLNTPSPANPVTTSTKTAKEKVTAQILGASQL